MAELDERHGQHWSLYHGDCCQILPQLPDHSIGLTVFSPPFVNLFTYSDHIADMGNSKDNKVFFEHYNFLLKELVRLMKPGRIVAVHCSDLPTMKWRDGEIGLYDFSGDLIEAHLKAGFVYHSRITIWKSPVVEMQRTKALGLLYKQLKKDSIMSRVGMPDYVLLFRAPGDNEVPVAHEEQDFSLDQWQEWASPVWMTINQTNTLNVIGSREANDERHIAPLQLDLIERVIRLWSNPGETVLSPFAGIGSEGYVAVKHQRRFVGVELKRQYFLSAAKNLQAVASERGFFRKRA